MIRRYLPFIAGVLMLTAVVVGAAMWFSFRIYVPHDKCAVLIRKMGTALPAGESVATEKGQKGIQQEVLGPGRHFRNPVIWDHELVDLTEIRAGDPSTWQWISSLNKPQRDQLRAGTFQFAGEFPQIGVVTRRVGAAPNTNQVIVSRKSGVKGILREVLTPGTYKINPYIFDVQQHPAAVIPAGFVGVVTNLFGEEPEADAVRATSLQQADQEEPVSYVRPLANKGQRGTLIDVLQPGVYFINPKLQKVTLIEIGFNEYSQIRVSDDDNFRISFPSDTGYLIKVGVTVVWGIDPTHAAETINEFGNIDRVLDKVIGPQLRSICRNIGSTYAARDFIHGEKREEFQIAMTAELQRVCNKKNIEILIALVREIEVLAPSQLTGEGTPTEDLKRTIQESYISIEHQLTKAKQREAAAIKAKLEEERKKVDIARETIRAETRIKVAEILAEGAKKAAEIEAQAELDVATVQEEIAKLDAKRTEILGGANAAVEKMKKDAEAKGYELLVNALGGGAAYNLYTFADRFEPESIQLFFAGDGTFWTDLKRFEEVGAAKLLESPTTKASSR